MDVAIAYPEQLLRYEEYHVLEKRSLDVYETLHGTYRDAAPSDTALITRVLFKLMQTCTNA